MDYPYLVTASDLEGQSGAPFDPARVEAVAEALRLVVGWHIAPSVTETVTLDHDGAGILLLPSLYVTDVVAVRDVSGDTPRDLTGWRWSSAGMIDLRGGAPRGFRSVEVDFVHGYDKCPPALLTAITSGISGRVVQESLGSRSVTLSAEDVTFSPASVVDRFRLRGRP